MSVEYKVLHCRHGLARLCNVERLEIKVEGQIVDYVSSFLMCVCRWRIFVTEHREASCKERTLHPQEIRVATHHPANILATIMKAALTR